MIIAKKKPFRLGVKRTSYAKYISFRHVRVDHGRLQAYMAKQLLNSSDIISIFQKVCSKTVSQRMHRSLLWYAGLGSVSFLV
jgi:hypothetical protein